MNKVSRYILAAIFGGLTTILLCAAYTSESLKRSRTSCSGIEVCIRDSSINRFVCREDIIRHISGAHGDPVGKLLDSLDIAAIEKTMDNWSPVRKSEVYLTKDGILHVTLVQRTPLLRFQKDSIGFYADADGVLFPLQPGHTAHVPVIDGNIPLNAGDGYHGRPASEWERQWTDRIVSMVRFMKSNDIWLKNIAQIHVNEAGDLVLIPYEGREKFIFGQPVGTEDKFRKIELYYTAIVPDKGKDMYSTVNLKYDGRIICRK